MADSTTFTGFTKVSVSGPISCTSRAQTVAASITNLASDNSVVIISGSNSSAIALHGIAAGIDGQVIDVIQLSTGALTFKHQSGSATGAQITTLTGSDVATTGAGAGRLIYSTVQSKWLLVGSQA